MLVICHSCHAAVALFTCFAFRSKHKFHMEVLIGPYDKIYLKYIEVLEGQAGKSDSMTCCRMRRENNLLDTAACLIVNSPLHSHD